MVKNRGIDIFIISQFDIQRLPEFPPTLSHHPSDQLTTKSNSNTNTNTVTRYIPIYPGSQIWFEYTIEPPHPPNAAYLFKLLVNGKPVTAWDCTEKHGYHGKMIYILERAGVGQEEEVRRAVQRRGFRFSSCEGGDVGGDGGGSDVIEIRVHRIEHRRRLRDCVPERDEALDGVCGENLEFINGGILEPGRPQRRYQYQLLDPQDEPFAVFRFLYRTFDYLQRNNIIPAPAPSLRSASTTSTSWYDAHSTTVEHIAENEQVVTSIGGNVVSSNHKTVSPQRNCIHLGLHNDNDHQHPSPAYSHRITSNSAYLPPSDSDESLSVIARDSIESLPSTIARTPAAESPRPIKRFSILGPSCYPASATTSRSQSPPPERPHHSPSPRQRLKKRLTLDLDRGFTSPEKPRRPLSPFTSAGLLRRITGMSPDVVGESAGTMLTTVGNESDRADGVKKATVLLGRAGSKSERDRPGLRSEQAGSEGRSWMGFFGRKVNQYDRGDLAG